MLTANRVAAGVSGGAGVRDIGGEGRGDFGPRQRAGALWCSALKPEAQPNVLGGPLEPCSFAPATGFFRDGHCHTCPEDLGCHAVCVQVDERFLEFSKAGGNDLSTPAPEYGFPGLKPGDRWCVCAPRWKEAFDAGAAAPVVLAATAQAALEFIPRSVLEEYGIDALEEL